MNGKTLPPIANNNETIMKKQCRHRTIRMEIILINELFELVFTKWFPMYQ